MNKVQKIHSFVGTSVARKAIIAGLVLSISACGSTESLWQGEEVLVAGRQEVLERNVYNVSDDHRELKDRFNALERLYVELVHQMRAQSGQVAELTSEVAKVEADPEAAARLTRVRGDVTAMREQMKKLENRVFSVEMSEQSAGFDSSAIPTSAPTTSAGGGQASTQPISNTPVVAVNNNAQSQQTFYGVHLASYRTNDQVGSGWAGLIQSFSGDLEGLTPLIYTQSQEGIGTFLRLIAGPMINEQEADALCTRIRQTASEQYCRVSEYQGEPVD